MLSQLLMSVFEIQSCHYLHLDCLPTQENITDMAKKITSQAEESPLRNVCILESHVVLHNVAAEGWTLRFLQEF